MTTIDRHGGVPETKGSGMKAQVEVYSDLIVRTTLRAKCQRIGFERPTDGRDTNMPFMERAVDGVAGPWVFWISQLSHGMVQLP
jgi:hypothetical protein